MKKTRIGKGSPVVGVVACVHGNEIIGYEIIERLKDVSPDKGTIDLVVANEEAMVQDTRFIETDLNRSFPGDEYGSHEERLAVQLIKELSGCDYVIDLHSTTGKTDSFVIITQESTRQLASCFPLGKVVFMEPALANGKAMIEYLDNAISPEFDCRIDPEHAFELVFACLINLGVMNGAPYKVSQERYSAYGLLKKDGRDMPFVNFKEATVDGEIFYPVLHGEAAYKDLFCVKARRDLAE